MTLSDLMTKNVLTVKVDVAFTEACRLMQQMKIHHLPVVDEDNQLIGIFTANDALKAYNEKVFNQIITVEEDINDLIKIEELMTDSNIYDLTPESRPEEALILMKEFDVHSIPVLDDGEVVGIVTSTDILNHCEIKNA